MIRPWHVDDAEEAFAMYGDPEVARYLTGVTEESVDTQREMLKRIIAAYSHLNRGMGSFPLIEKSSGQLVGCILLKPLPRTDDLEAWVAFRDNANLVPPIHEIEIGWHLNRDHWGKGFATEAAVSMMQYGREELKLPEIHAVLFAENVASRKVTERLGMRHLGSTDRFYGKTVEHYVSP